MDDLTRRVQLSGWLLSIGPTDLSEPTPSWALDGDLPWYEPGEVAAAILGIPGCSLVSPADPACESWAARWEAGDRVIQFSRPEVVTFDGDAAPRWGGCDLEADCQVGDVLAAWEAIHSRFPGIWPYNPDSWYQTRDSFITALGRGE